MAADRTLHPRDRRTIVDSLSHLHLDSYHIANLNAMNIHTVHGSSNIRSVDGPVTLYHILPGIRCSLQRLLQFFPGEDGVAELHLIILRPVRIDRHLHNPLLILYPSEFIRDGHSITEGKVQDAVIKRQLRQVPNIGTVGPFRL